MLLTLLISQSFRIKADKDLGDFFFTKTRVFELSDFRNHLFIDNLRLSHP